MGEVEVARLRVEGAGGGGTEKVETAHAELLAESGDCGAMLGYEVDHRPRPS
jgi:hypothetical protein